MQPTSHKPSRNPNQDYAEKREEKRVKCIENLPSWELQNEEEELSRHGETKIKLEVYDADTPRWRETRIEWVKERDLSERENGLGKRKDRTSERKIREKRNSLTQSCQPRQCNQTFYWQRERQCEAERKRTRAEWGRTERLGKRERDTWARGGRMKKKEIIES